MNKIFFLILTSILFACGTEPAKNSSVIHDQNSDSSQSKDSTTKISSNNQLLDLGKYCNNRFDFCINYPKRLLTQETESENGDGTDFSNNRNEFVLTVFGRNNLDPNGETLSLRRQFDSDITELRTKGDTISYKRLSSTFYIVSGKRKGKIFYQKTISKKDAFAFAILEYSVNERSIYDPVAQGIFSSFK
jgi:hypothetical protein